MCMIGMMCHDVFFFFPFQLAVGIALFLPDHVQVCQWAQVSLERWAASAPAQTGQTQGTQTQHVFSCFLVQTARHRWKKSIGTDIDNWIYVGFMLFSWFLRIISWLCRSLRHLPPLEAPTVHFSTCRRCDHWYLHTSEAAYSVCCLEATAESAPWNPCDSRHGLEREREI